MPKRTKSQTLGIDIVTAFSRDPKLKDARISVGTTSDTVILNGTVANREQSKLAGSVARQKATGYKLVNHLQIGAPATPPAHRAK